MGFQVRPFERVIERPEGTAAVKVCGSITDGVFVFSVHGSSWPLPTDTCAADQHGAYAILQVAEIQLADGFLIRVQESVDVSDEEGRHDSGCEISLVKPGDAEAYGVRERGLTPDEIQVLVPPEALISVCFGSTGHVCGYGCTGLPQQFPNYPVDPEAKRVLN